MKGELFLNVLLTGATGFIGRRIADTLVKKREHRLTCVTRRPISIPHGHEVKIKALEEGTDWSDVVSDQGVIVHAAARAHILHDDVADPLEEYRKINVEGTLNLARQAVRGGVRRFVFISSIGVNGNISQIPFKKDDTPAPAECYAQSKWEAEQGLWSIHRETGLEVVVIRPPLVYGPNAPGNFAVLSKWVEKSYPLPLGAIHNKRSLVALDNLVDLIITCIDHPGAANQTFLVSDGEDLSTTQLLKGVAEAMGRPSRLISVPAGLLQFGATLLGKKAVAQRLLGSLQVDISHTQKTLNWTPPLTVKQGLQRCFQDHQD